MTPDELLDAEPDLNIDIETQTYDLNSAVPIEHRHELIVGNELRCTLHDGTCPVIRVKPTEVLERNDAGELVLVDKMP